MRTAVLIDRDGTMGGDYYVKSPQDYYPYPGTAEAFRLLNEAHLPSIIITNQSCIARKLDFGYDFDAEFRAIGATDWFICPHDNEDHCHCRKPETGLIEQAQARHGLELESCYMIGDRWTDMVAGGKMGLKLVLVMTGRGDEAMGKDRDKWAEFEPVHVAENLLEAVKWIIRQEK